MADQYKVELSELEGTITKLNGVLSRLGNADSNAKTNTYLPAGALGTGFDEADSLASAHSTMKTHIEDVVTYLNDVVNSFGDKTKKVHGAYQDSEYDAQSGFRG
ncbi:hypothetical protein ACH429_05195 [Streptomyces pathocidini]|uniref:Uncharacterized protein n=1 Tax=Streptomyces pathocidini TaxID=1650571 RepID=A0ABW7UNU6_9ACTN|nr:hypothetical protein [Streptomyces pathocidini]